MKFRSILKVSNLLKILSLLIFLGLSYTIVGQMDDPLRDGIPSGMYDNLPPTVQSPMAPVTVADYDNFNLGNDFAECHISINPMNPLEFFTAYNINGTHHTENGHDWAINNPGFPSAAGDPCTAYDSLGNLFYETMKNPVSGTWIVRSTNNGKNWMSVVSGNSGFDKNWFCADQTGGPYANYIYGTMSASGGANFMRSINNGASFSIVTSFSYSPLPGTMPCVGPGPTGISGGSVYVVGNSGSSFASTYIFYRSSNGGTSFTLMSAQNFVGYLGTAVAGRNSIHNMRLRPYPFIVADNSFGPYRGRLYLVYATNNPPGDGNKSDVYCRYSNDGGATWSSGVIVNDDANSQNNYQFQPAVWVEKTSGRVYIQFMDTRDTPTTDSALVYATHSDNGGVSFATNKQISNQKMRIDCPTCGGGGYPRYQGDYTSITSNSKTSMVNWTDFRYGSFSSFVAYYPDFAMKVYPALDSLNANNGSVDFRFSIPSIKAFTDVASFSATVSPPPGSGTLAVTFPNGNTLPSPPQNKPMRVTATGGVTSGTYTITVTGQGSNGTPVHKRTVTVYVSPTVTGIGNNTEIINKYELSQNYPNPFNPSTKIEYNILQKSNVKITVFDMLGKVVTTFNKPQQDPGKNFVIFDARNLASGVYYYKIQAGDFTDTKKMLLMK